MTTPDLEANTYAKVDRRLLPFLFLCYILAYLDRVNMGFAKLQMLQDLSLSEVAFGTGAGIFFAGYFLFEVPSNLLLKKFGARTWITRIMVSWGILSSAMMWVKSEWAFYGVRFLLGVAEAGFFPGIIFYLTLWYPSKLRSTRTAWFISAIAVAGVVGNPISGLIMESLAGTLGLAGWKWLFLAEGLPSILVGICVWFYLDSNIVQAKWLGAEEKALLIRNFNAEDRYKHRHKVLDAFKSGRVYALCAIYFTLMIGLYGISFWLPSIVEAMGVKGYLEVGLITAIPYAVAVVGMVFLSRSSDRTGERRFHYVLNVTAGSLGLVLSAVFRNHPLLAIIFLSIGTLGVIGSMPLFWPVPSTFLAGTAAAAGIGIVNSIGNLGGYVGPNIPVWTKHYTEDPSASLYVIAGALLISALVAFLAIPVTPRATGTPSAESGEVGSAGVTAPARKALQT
ncbi:MAG: MFS transporter [Verrucomicrobia bacterium]|nr:MFS transporter [Verrucomicrobiota bacterium]